MTIRKSPVRRQLCLAAAIFLSSGVGTVALASSPARQTGQSVAPATARPVGTIKAISGNIITLTTDTGSDVTVLIQLATKFVQIAPGQKDLKDAMPVQLQDVHPGDRILVRGTLADDGKSILAVSVIAMKKADIAEKQARERDEWSKHGTGGLVNSLDAASGTITISLPALGEKKTVAIHLSKDTILRRYAPDSIKFDDAKPAPLDQIKPGDQLRARGARTADGNELTAEEIVSGTFRNIAGTISALDPSAASITVEDLITNKPITLKITADSQLRKLPPAMAQRIALHLKGIPSDASPQGTAGGGAAQMPRTGGAPSSGPGVGGAGGMGRPGGGGPPDLQQAINRMPRSTLADLQKGDVVMIVATEGGATGIPSAITLLAGVEPILAASPKSNASTLLSPWSLSSAPSGEGAVP